MIKIRDALFIMVHQIHSSMEFVSDQVPWLLEAFNLLWFGWCRHLSSDPQFCRTYLIVKCSACCTRRSNPILQIPDQVTRGARPLSTKQYKAPCFADRLDGCPKLNILPLGFQKKLAVWHIIFVLNATWMKHTCFLLRWAEAQCLFCACSGESLQLIECARWLRKAVSITKCTLRTPALQY